MTGQILRVPRGTKPTSDKMAVFLDELMHATAVTKQRRRGEFVRISGKHLNSWLGSDVRVAIGEAESAGYIEIDPSFVPGEHSMGYRLAKKYRCGDSVDYVRQTKARAIPCARVRITDGNPASWSLFNWFPCAEIPTEAVARGWNRFAVDSVLKRDWYCVRCENGRFHSSFTGIPRSVRKMMTLNGKRVVESDVANCQALFLGLSAQERVNQLEIDKEGSGARSVSPSTIFQYDGSCSLIGGCRKEAVFTGSIATFMAVACAGLVYETVCEEATRNGEMLFDWVPEKHRRWVTENRRLNRNDVKKQFIVMAFASLPEMLAMPIFRHFARLWPDMAEYLCEAKREDRPLEPREKAHTAVANECQRRESALMIDRVAWRLALRMPIITIHDAIASLEEDADAVRSEITQAFREIGLGVKVETD